MQRTRNNGFVIALTFCFLADVAGSDAGWQRFRGPNGTGISDSTGLPLEFGPGRNLVWRTPLPPGHSSPVVGNRLVFVTAFEGDKLFVIAVNRKDGGIAWQREVPRTRADRIQKPNNAASPTPVTDGGNVYAFFQDFGLISFDEKGRERWRLTLGPFNVYYGFGASPILVDDRIILACDQDATSYLIAVNRNTGRVLWRVDRPGVISGYSTPVVWQPKGGARQIVIPESFQLSSYSLDDGRRVWHVNGLACEMKATPSLSGDMLFINGWGWPENQPGRQIYLTPFEEALTKHDTDRDGKISRDEMPHERLKHEIYFKSFDTDQDGGLNQKEWDLCRAMMAAENGLLAIALGGVGDTTSTAIRWRYQKPVPQVPSTLVSGGVLFMVNDSGILISFDPATGDLIKQGRLKGAIDKYFASPVGAEGRVYLISQDGTVTVVKAVGDWEVLAVNALDEEVFATPAIAGGRLYIRTTSALHCYGAKTE
jgi:outer membrane protein assembly factor BamB